MALAGCLGRNDPDFSSEGDSDAGPPPFAAAKNWRMANKLRRKGPKALKAWMESGLAPSQDKTMANGNHETSKRCHVSAVRGGSRAICERKVHNWRGGQERAGSQHHQSSTRERQDGVGGAGRVAVLIHLLCTHCSIQFIEVCPEVIDALSRQDSKFVEDEKSSICNYIMRVTTRVKNLES